MKVKVVDNLCCYTSLKINNEISRFFNMYKNGIPKNGKVYDVVSTFVHPNAGESILGLNVYNGHIYTLKDENGEIFFINDIGVEKLDK
jgi:hypothetical protein